VSRKQGKRRGFYGERWLMGRRYRKDEEGERKLRRAKKE
jgi:hypothetical protein